MLEERSRITASHQNGDLQLFIYFVPVVPLEWKNLLKILCHLAVNFQ